jgi:D-proline reductase (dithiol) PrdB
MGDYSEFKLPVRLFLQAYPWRRIHPLPHATLPKPLSQSRIAIVSSAGLVPTGVEPFDQKKRGGDYSYRLIPNDVRIDRLTDCHRSDTFDHSGIEADPNLAFPLKPMAELVQEGYLGELAPRHLSFMGSITAPRRLIKHSAPEAAHCMVDDQVDGAILIPV